MTCRDAEHLIFAARDGALEETQRASLSSHLTGCASCRRVREQLEHGFAEWREATVSARVPNADLEWRKLERRINQPERRRPLLAWLALPAAIGAAAAVALYVSPRNPTTSIPTTQNTVAQTQVVPAAQSIPSTVVYVDDKSGWTFVWAPDAGTDGQHI
jgi:anti-sigma factor RsiW